VQRLEDLMPTCSLSPFYPFDDLFMQVTVILHKYVKCCFFFLVFRLLEMYLDPQDGKEPMFTAAVRLLHNHGESLDPLQVLEVLSSIYISFNK
jgi:hypothetical protein